MSTNKSGSPGHPTDNDAARTPDGQSRDQGSDMDRAGTDAVRGNGHEPKTTDRRMPPPPPKPKP